MTVEDGSTRIKRRDLASDELLGTSTDSYWDFEYPGGVFVARTVDRRFLQLDPTSLQPIGAPLPGIAELNGIEIRTWLAEVTDGQVGPLIAQPLTISATKDVVLRRQEIGRVVVRCWGFINEEREGP